MASLSSLSSCVSGQEHTGHLIRLVPCVMPFTGSRVQRCLPTLEDSGVQHGSRECHVARSRWVSIERHFVCLNDSSEKVPSCHLGRGHLHAALRLAATPAIDGCRMAMACVRAPHTQPTILNQSVDTPGTGVVFYPIWGGFLSLF